MNVLLGVVLGLLLFCWVGEWLGFRAAAVALGLYTIEPNIAAHSSLVTTDLGVTCFIFGAVYFLWRTSRRLTSRTSRGSSVCFVLAMLSKFSAAILGPVDARAPGDDCLAPRDAVRRRGRLASSRCSPWPRGSASGRPMDSATLRARRRAGCSRSTITRLSGGPFRRSPRSSAGLMDTTCCRMPSARASCTVRDWCRGGPSFPGRQLQQLRLVVLLPGRLSC